MESEDGGGEPSRRARAVKATVEPLRKGHGLPLCSILERVTVDTSQRRTAAVASQKHWKKGLEKATDRGLLRIAHDESANQKTQRNWKT